MKSGQKFENRLIGPGNNDYGRENKPKIIKELPPDIIEKILKDFRKRAYDDKVSKEAVLHNLKQLKAQMGKIKATYMPEFQEGIIECMNAIDKKIAKINSK